MLSCSRQERATEAAAATASNSEIPGRETELRWKAGELFLSPFVVLSIPAWCCCSGSRLAWSVTPSPRWTQSRAAPVRRRLQERINVKPKGAASWWFLIQHLSGLSADPRFCRILSVQLWVQSEPTPFPPAGV